MDALEAGWEQAAQTQGWFTRQDLEVMVSLAQEVPREGVIVEVGVWKGRSFCGMGPAAEGKRHVAVDHFKGSNETWHQEDPDIGRLREVFEANLEKFGMLGRVEIVAEASLEAAKKFADESIDLLLLDGSHETADVVADTDAWWPKIKPGGKMAFHDWEKPWVKEAILAGASKWKWAGGEKAPYLYVARKKNLS